jgi:hypothetical protein
LLGKENIIFMNLLYFLTYTTLSTRYVAIQESMVLSRHHFSVHSAGYLFFAK